MRAGRQRLPAGNEYQRSYTLKNHALESHALKSNRTKNGGHGPPFLFVTTPRMGSELKNQVSDQRLLGDDNAVVIGVDVVARTEGHPAEGHRHIQVTQTALLTLARVRAQRLNT